MIGLHFGASTDTPLRVLCLGSHSDDIEIGCGGTLLHLIQTHPNCAVLWVVFGAGDVRKAEALASAHVFLAGTSGDGTSPTHTIRVASFQDGFFPEHWGDIKRYFEKEIKSFAPDLIFTHYREDRHQDHRIISDLTWNTFRNHLILEYEIPKYDGDLSSPNVFVPLDEAVCRQKIAHLMKHFASQRNKHWFSEDTFWSLLRIRGMESASTFAEAFYGRKLNLTLTL